VRATGWQWKKEALLCRHKRLAIEELRVAALCCGRRSEKHRVDSAGAVVAGE